MIRSALIAAALLAACTTQTPVAEETPPTGAIHLSGTSWVQQEPVADNPPTIQFEDARAAGFAGCNRWFAQVTQDGEALRFSAAGATRMACPEPAMAVESAFLSVLERTRYGHYDQDALVLLDENQAPLARFTRAP